MKQLLNWYKKIMPSMSATEREVMDAGTVGFEKELFNGVPNFKAFLNQPKAHFTSEEERFFAGPLNTLCRLLDDWEITHEYKDLPVNVWEFIKKEGFLGLIIPKQYGGLAFSASAVAKILMTLSGRSVTAATTVAVPNSLGPAELLLHYGTEKQKNYYLPRLAHGEEIPCFALTGPEAGSDAASIPDLGRVCQREWEGKLTRGISLNWNKRYITLCPVATVIGLAFHLLDPENIISEKVDIGITCALIPANTPGVIHGRRHFPLGTAFMNGPTQGHDVFIPLDWVIGGEAMVGQGWRMLMECLSAGRGVALPAGAAGGAQAAALSAGAYARIRQQFGLPIAQFEGIQASLAKAAGYTYIINAGLKVTTASIDQGEKPAILSAILKCYTTEMARKVFIEAMDIHGGKAICLGPRNYLAQGFQAMPIAITVEGANILTRNLIIYGKGMMRCHPYLNEEMESALANDEKRFHKAILGHVKMIATHFCRVFACGWRWSIWRPKPSIQHYFQQICHYSTVLAFLSDVAMMLLKSQLKRKERISARLADILAFLYLSSAVLKSFHNENSEKEDLPFVHWSCQTLLYDIEEAVGDILNNLTSKMSVFFLKKLFFPLGRRLKKPSDLLEHEVASLITHSTLARSRLFSDVFTESLHNNPLGQLESTFKKVLAVEDIEQKIVQAVKKGVIAGFTRQEKMEEACAKNIITPEEKESFLQAELARQEVLAVDDFDSFLG